MKYIVYRTNEWYWEGETPNPKCPGAVQEILPKHGKDIKAYTIEINTLEELMKLKKDLNEPLIIFDGTDYGFNLPVLEIYDTYRE